MYFHENINGIEVTAYFSEHDIQEVFLPLLKRLSLMQSEKRHRIIAMLAAPPGMGKTTLAHFLEHLSEATPGFTPIRSVGIDGFHRYQDYLLSHTVMRDGVSIPMVRIKGAPVTFDLDRLIMKIKEAASGSECGWPDYNRILHNPVEDALVIDRDIILLEGNYLLLDEPGWRNLKELADYTIKITACGDDIRQRLIARKEASGASHEEAVRHVDFSDMANVRLCLGHSLQADLDIRLGG